MNIAVRRSFPEDNTYNWFDSLRQYELLGAVEVAFYKTSLFQKNVSIEKVFHPFEQLKIKAVSVHMAQTRIDESREFKRIFEKTIEIAKKLNCNKIVVHPSNGTLKELMALFENYITPKLKEHQIYLCWETFSGRRRIFSGIDDIINYCKDTKFHRVCYDFSHLHYQQARVIQDIEKYLDYILVFHLSNRSEAQMQQHLPFQQGDVDFSPIFELLKKRNYTGDIVLEYLPEFHQEQLSDALYLKEKIT